VRPNFFLAEIADRFAQVTMRLGKIEIHRPSTRRIGVLPGQSRRILRRANACTLSPMANQYPPPPPGGGWSPPHPAADPYAPERALQSWAQSRGVTINASPDARWYSSWAPFVYLPSFARVGREARARVAEAPTEANAFVVETFEGDPIKQATGDDRLLVAFVTSPRLAYRAAIRSRSGGGVIDDLSRGFDAIVGTGPSPGSVLGDPTLERIFDIAVPTRDEGNAALPIPLRQTLLQSGFRGVLELRPGGLICALYDRRAFDPATLDALLGAVARIHQLATQYAVTPAPA
jgi:hypothetical protein